MSDAIKEPGSVVFSDFVADLRTGELRKDGVVVRLPAQSFQVLRLLLQRPGELVTRQALQRGLWPNDAFGDFEHGLNAAVNRLREALGDSADVPRFIETLPRRGYRFISETAPYGEADQSDPPLQPSQGAPPEIAAGVIPTPARRLSWGRIQIAILIALAVAMASALLLWRQQSSSVVRPASQASQPQMVVTPLTALPGIKFAPTFSPDGSQVAFAWDGGKTEQSSPYDLYVKVVGSERLQQITHRPSSWLVPAWSPDGRNIAFARNGEGLSGIFVVSALGGPERKLADAHFQFNWPISLSWSPDGRTLVYAEQQGMHAVDFASAEVRPLNAPATCPTAFTPAFSPSGQWIAFSCYHDSTYDLYLAPGSGGAATKIRTVNDIPYPMAWSNDSEQILYTEHGQLFGVSRSGGAPHLYPFEGDKLQPAVATRGNRLAFAAISQTINLWRMDVDRTTRPLASPLSIMSSAQLSPDISPDGKRVVFESWRSGADEIWVSAIDGSDALRLTDFHSLTGSPRWSPDGKMVVFNSRESGEAGLYLVDPLVGVPHRIALNGLDGQIPRWSRDGKWIYFQGAPVNTGGLYKVGIAGGIPQLVTTSPGTNAQESRDGSSLYFTRGVADADLYVRDLARGVERRVDGMPSLHTPVDWVLASNGIYFVSTATKEASICFFDLSVARVTRSWPLPRPPDFWGGLSLSPDESWLAYAQVDRNESDLKLAEPFR